jgi:hypothetical protein
LYIQCGNTYLVKRLRLFAGQGEEVDEGAQLSPGHVAEAPDVLSINGRIERIDQRPAGPGEVRRYATAILDFANPAYPTSFLHPVQQPGDVWHPVDEPIANFISHQSLRSRAPQDAEHVVLREADASLLEQFLHRFAKGRLCSGNAQGRFLLEAAERLPLLEFISQGGRHEKT